MSARDDDEFGEPIPRCVVCKCDMGALASACEDEQVCQSCADEAFGSPTTEQDV